VGRHLGKHLLQQFGAPHFHRLDRDLNNDRRSRFRGSIQNRCHRQVIDDVERSYAISGFKGRLQDFSEGYRWHSFKPVSKDPPGDLGGRFEQTGQFVIQTDQSQREARHLEGGAILADIIPDDLESGVFAA
jgi:hypothetical protein